MDRRWGDIDRLIFDLMSRDLPGVLKLLSFSSCVGHLCLSKVDARGSIVDLWPASRQ